MCSPSIDPFVVYSSSGRDSIVKITFYGVITMTTVGGAIAYLGIYAAALAAAAGIWFTLRLVKLI